MTDAELFDLRARVDAQVATEIEKQLTANRTAIVHKEIDAVLRELTRNCVASRRDAIKLKVETWLDNNVDNLVTVVAKQMIDEALSEVKRRVLGRK